MKNTVIFSDWTSVNQIINSINPDMKASCVVITNCNEDGINEIIGYKLNITERTQLLYSIPVETSLPNVWSLSSEEAVEMLNTIGFICEYQLPEYYETLGASQLDLLKSLKNLGYTHIVRHFIHGKGSVIVLNPDSPSSVYDIKNTANYNYQNWISLKLDDFILIDSLLDINKDTSI